MGKNPASGIVFGALAIALALYSLATQAETPPAGYNLLNYGLILAGAAGIIGSLVVNARRTRGPGANS